MVFKKTVSSHTDVVGEATEILQSVNVVVVLDDILYSSVCCLDGDDIEALVNGQLELVKC